MRGSLASQLPLTFRLALAECVIDAKHRGRRCECVSEVVPVVLSSIPGRGRERGVHGFAKELCARQWQ